MSNFTFIGIAEALGIAQILRRLNEVASALKTHLSEIKEQIMSVENAIARLTTLSEKIDAAVSTEMAEAAGKIASRDQAIAQKDAAIAELKTALDIAKESAASPESLAALDEALAKVEESTGKIADIVMADNPTPITDIIVDSVQADPAPTPPEVAPIVVEEVSPTPAGDVAANAITEAVEEIAAD
jgi:hypothetical protein